MKPKLPDNIELIELPGKTLNANLHRLFFLCMLFSFIFSLLSLITFFWLPWQISLKLFFTFILISIICYPFVGIFNALNDEEKQTKNENQ